MTINDLVDSLIIEVPGCPIPTIRDMLRWAQRELCDKGNTWIVSDGPVVVGADTPYAEVEAPPGAEVLRIISLLQDGRPLRPGVDYRQGAAGGVEMLRGTPGSSYLLGSIACRPAHGKDMPPDLLSRWDEALTDGALYRLLGLPQPWGNPGRAEFHRIKFSDAQSNARHLASDGAQYGSVRMKTRGFI